MVSRSMNSDDFGKYKDVLHGESNYAKLFGTPERAARTLVDISERANLDGIGGDYDALLEWLRGDA